MSAMESQITSMRVDCIRFTLECDKQTKVISELREKKKELDDDRKFLDFEIRDCRQQNQSLKVTISKTHNICDDLTSQKEEIASKYQSEINSGEVSRMKLLNSGERAFRTHGGRELDIP